MMESGGVIVEIVSMTPAETNTVVLPKPVASLEEVQQGWHDLASRVGQLEAENSSLEEENKALRFLLERVIEHRQKSHGELVHLLSNLVSKLPINDVGVVVSRLIEHNTNVNEVCAALTKGTVGMAIPQPTVLKALDQTKRDLLAAIKPAVEELIRLDTPLEEEVLKSLISQPVLFFSPQVVRANRCFLKGQVTRERIVRQFGEQALLFFNDMTTDPKRNPRPKPEEVVLAFKNDFEALFGQNATLIPDKRENLQALYQKVQKSKAATEQARLQKIAFAKLSFFLELLHYYENQNTETPDVVFAQRLPALIEQLVIVSPQDNLDEKLIEQAESCLGFVISPDHRQMIVNNIGKGDGLAKILKYVLRFRADKSPDQNPAIAIEVVPEFIKHLIPPKTATKPETIVTVLRLISPDMQRSVARAIMSFDRLQRRDAETLGMAVGKELGLTGLESPTRVPDGNSAENEQQIAWGKIKELIIRRAEPALIAAAIRDRLHAKYDPEEVKESWITLIEADPIALIRVFCRLPYLPDGKTDPVARAVMETYVSRLLHEKYAAVYSRVINSLKNMFKANPESPTLVNFMALVKWVDTEAANKLSLDIGMPLVAK